MGNAPGIGSGYERKARKMATYCEDFPCCGHEMGDCDGSLYGSDESIKARVYEAIRTGHGDCDHQEGIYNCEDTGEEEDWDDE